MTFPEAGRVGVVDAGRSERTVVTMGDSERRRTPTNDFFGRDGEPISMAEWSRLRTQDSYRSVAADTVRSDGSDVVVFTTWFGTDQGPYGASDQPTIFGTIAAVRGEGGDYMFLDDTERFACDETEALSNHAAARDAFTR